jgi:hypothetical protein
MLADFPVLYVDGIVRRTIASCALLAVVALVVAFLSGQYLAGAGVLLGLAAATVNHRLFQISTAHYSNEEGHLQRKPYAGSVAARLGAITVIAFALLFLAKSMGFGMIGGLVAFQVLLMVNALATLWRYQKVQLAGSGARAEGCASQDGTEAGTTEHEGPVAGLPGGSEGGTNV